MVTSSRLHYSVRVNRTYFLVTDIIWVFIWIFYHYLAEPNYLSMCENFPYFVIGSGAQELSHGPFFLMEPVNPVFPGEGRWLIGDASAWASEETGVQSDLIRTLQTTFQLSQKFFLMLEDCMLSFWSLCSRSLMYSSSVEELVLLKEDHKKDINSSVVRLPDFCSWQTDVVAESVEDMFPSFKCRCFAMVLGGTETMRLTLNGKEWHSRTTSTNSNVREVSP